jgi:hypothetical protein
VGVRLLCFFVDRGFPASAQMVLDMLLTCAAPAASFPTLARAVAGSDGLGLLHRAVRSGSTAMLLAVMSWGVQHRHCFAWDAPGPMGLTPLHLTALLGKQKRPLAAMVLQSSPGEFIQGLQGSLLLRHALDAAGCQAGWWKAVLLQHSM